MKVEIKVSKGGQFPTRLSVGDAIDLTIAENVELKAWQYQMLNLGVSIKLPKGFVGILLPRSSTFNKYGILLANSVGFIDNSYCGDNDIWRFPAYPTRDISIVRGTRIAQFIIMPSQFATPWQKLKWLFTRKIKLVEVDNLQTKNRGGLGSTGI